MSVTKKVKQTFRYLLNVPLEVITYVGTGVRRIFSPSDDQYPATGVQPFDGKVEDKKKNRRYQAW